MTIRFIRKTMFTWWCHDLLVPDLEAAKKSFCSRIFGTDYQGRLWVAVRDNWIVNISTVKQSRACLSCQNVIMRSRSVIKDSYPQWIESCVVSHAALKVGAKLCQRNICLLFLTTHCLYNHQQGGNLILRKILPSLSSTHCLSFTFPNLESFCSFTHLSSPMHYVSGHWIKELKSFEK